MAKTKGDCKDLGLAPIGRKRIEWANNDMPVLQLVRERFDKEKPLKGLRMSCCLHVTAETANLVRTLKAGGADVALCASNLLSTQDDVAACLIKDFGIATFAVKGETREKFYEHLNATLDHKPNVTMDDGADLVQELHTSRQALAQDVVASLEETTTGVIRLRAMQASGALRFPIIAVNDATTKHMFDNRYGTGQSTVDGIIRATDALMAGRKIVVAGYGWCGKGVASRMKGLGAIVTVTEIDPLRALEAVMDGFDVRPMEEAAEFGEVYVTVTGNKHVLRNEHFAKMRDGAIVCNSGHFDIEIDIPALKKLSKKVTKGVRNNVDEYLMKDGRRIYLLADGRLVNLAAAEGHPASVMDMSFATQALATEFARKQSGRLSIAVHDVPKDIEDWVAKLKLKAMGIDIDTLTKDQQKYMKSFNEGT